MLPSLRPPRAFVGRAPQLLDDRRQERVRDRLVTARPVRRRAICRNILVVRCLAEICAIIWPLLAAVPNILEVERNGGDRLALDRLGEFARGSISGRLCMPTWLRQ